MFLIILSGDIELNPGPNKCLSHLFQGAIILLKEVVYNFFHIIIQFSSIKIILIKKKILNYNALL